MEPAEGAEEDAENHAGALEEEGVGQWWWQTLYKQWIEFICSSLVISRIICHKGHKGHKGHVGHMSLKNDMSDMSHTSQVFHARYIGPADNYVQAGHVC